MNLFKCTNHEQRIKDLENQVAFLIRTAESLVNLNGKIIQNMNDEPSLPNIVPGEAYHR